VGRRFQVVTPECEAGTPKAGHGARSYLYTHDTHILIDQKSCAVTPNVPNSFELSATGNVHVAAVSGTT
jgi:hypothetical protein